MRRPPRSHRSPALVSSLTLLVAGGCSAGACQPKPRPAAASLKTGQQQRCLCPTPKCPKTPATLCPTCAPCPPQKPLGRRGPFPLGDPAAEGLDAEKLAALLTEAEAQKSTAVLILKNGKLVVERYWGVDWREPLVTMSISKSIVALAVAQLIHAKKIKSLDQPVSDFIPSWSKGDRAAITIRHLLNHTSGLSSRRANRRRGRLARHARRTRVVTPPGTRFHYNNNAVDMFALIVHKATRRFIDDYLQRYLFGPLDVSGAYWYKYRDGHPRLAGELLIRPIDLLKIGKMMLDGGRWQGRQIVPKGWVRKLTAAGQRIYIPCGLLWWREARFDPRLDERVLAGWKTSGVAEATVEAARKALLGKTYRHRNRYLAALARAIGKKELRALRKLAKQQSLPLYGMVRRGPLRGFSARGSLGQHLIIVPRARLVALRMRLPSRSDRGRREKTTFEDFRERILKLAKPRRRR